MLEVSINKNVQMDSSVNRLIYHDMETEREREKTKMS
jgi:hypothetical protein